MPEQLLNRAVPRPTLAGDIDDSVTTLTLSNFPYDDSPGGDYRLAFDDATAEIIHVHSGDRSSLTFTGVERGAEGTTAAAHVGGTAVFATVTRDGLLALAGSLSGLSDVDLTSPADLDVLTYDSGSSKWINAPASGGGGILDQQSAHLSSDVSMPAQDTNYDGPSLSLAAGTWLLWARATFLKTSNNGNMYMVIWDGTNTFGAGMNTGFAVSYGQISAFGIAVLGGTTTVKITARQNSADATMVKNLEALDATTGYATELLAIQIA